VRRVLYRNSKYSPNIEFGMTVLKTLRNIKPEVYLLQPKKIAAELGSLALDAVSARRADGVS
jgi:hypothetical protein